MRTVPLTRGFLAAVDDEDFALVSSKLWTVLISPSAGLIYARNKRFLMHRFIMGLSDPKIKVDHIDGDGLNNQRCNLRICDQAHNAMNRRKLKAKSSKFKGVSLRKYSGRWASRIRIGQKLIVLGTYRTEEAAALVYNHAAAAYFGEFANLNAVVGVLEQPFKREGYNAKRREAYSARTFM